MSEERQLILQMLADGKISADEADRLLEAIEESERTAQETVVETAQRAERTPEGLAGLGRAIESAVSEATRALDQSLRSLEGRLDDQVRQNQLKHRVEDRIRRSTERAVAKVMEAEQRAAQAADRAARRVHIDRVTAERTSLLCIPAQAGDRLVLENRIGDVAIQFYDGDQVEVEARKTAWGSDEADANQRAEMTQISLVRNGAAIAVAVDRPSYTVVGISQLKDTRIDFTIRVPRGTLLQVAAKVGDIDLTVPKDAGFHYSLQTTVGSIHVDLLDETARLETAMAKEPAHTGTFGNGDDRIDVMVATGDIRLHH